MGTNNDDRATCAASPREYEEAGAALLTAAATDAALALGLVRVLTLLPLYDPALGEIEQRIAAVHANLIEVRRLAVEGWSSSVDGEAGEER